MTDHQPNSVRTKAKDRILSQVDAAFDSLCDHEIIAFAEMIAHLLAGARAFRDMRGMELDDVPLGGGS